eukprot:scaffold10.g2315.t1
MDEVFHVPQAQLYCAGQWREWHPKITTFPGLYVLGAAAGAAARALAPLLPARWAAAMAAAPGGCATGVLRAVNAAFAVACVPLAYHAARRLGPERSPQHLLLLAAAVFFFPLHFFFGYLYYTDVPSVFFTLGAHMAALDQRYGLAAGTAVAAVAMRQTNAVWVAFALGAAALELCLPPGSAGDGGGGGAQRSAERPANGSDAGAGSRPGAGRSKTTQAAGIGRGRAVGASSLAAAAGGARPQGLWAEAAHVAAAALERHGALAAALWPLAAVVAAFAGFVVWNGGVVVGDRAHHEAVRHLAQPLYFSLYVTAALAPAFWTPAALARAARRGAAAARRAPASAAACGAAAAAAVGAAVARGTLAHPFLLADNRHYTFYLWRRMVDRTHWARYAAAPAYLYSLSALHAALGHRPALWRAGFAAAVCLVLVPAHLLELRYFTTPALHLLLHMRAPRARALAATLVLWAAVDAAAVYVYLARPFRWPDGSVARFMW